MIKARLTTLAKLGTYEDRMAAWRCACVSSSLPLSALPHAPASPSRRASAVRSGNGVCVTGKTSALYRTFEVSGGKTALRQMTNTEHVKVSRRATAQFPI
ncbi:MAG: hypothetical protein ACKERG_04590 [Candidatus Hodgkinia cicadicola]